MRILFVIITTFLFAPSYSQFAVVEDKDGFVNIRSSGETNSKVLDTLKNGQIVWCFEPKANWIMIDYQKNGIIKSGYVYKNRLRFVSDYDTIPLRLAHLNQVTYEKDTIRVVLEETGFQAAKNKLQYAVNSGYPFVSKINGKTYWGTDGEIPRHQYKTIKAAIGKRSITFPFSAIENLFEPNLDYSECYYDRQKDILYISTTNGDGAGGYVVIWIVEKGKYKTRLVFNGF